MNIKSKLIILYLVSFPLSLLARDYTSKECPIVGNLKTHIYHLDGCPNYAEMLIKNKGYDNRKCFDSKKAAEDDGFRIAKTCKRTIYSK